MVETIEDERDDELEGGDEIEVEAEVEGQEEDDAVTLEGTDARQFRKTMKAVDHQGREMHEASTINCLADSLQMLSSAYSGDQGSIIDASEAIGQEILERVRLLGKLRREGLLQAEKEDS